MANSTAFQLTQMYSDLTGRRVAVIDGDKLARSEGRKAIGVYRVVEDGGTMLARVDVGVLASLGGILVGLPDQVVRQQVSASDLSEPLCDAMHEVLNITAAAISKRRVVLERMLTDAAQGDAALREVKAQPHRGTRFHITPAGFVAGEMELLTPLW